LSIKVNYGGLEFLESIDNLKEVLVLQEVSVISFAHLRDDGFNWEKHGILIEVLLKGSVLELLQLVESWLLFSNDVICESISLHELRELACSSINESSA
jgi:hypothetical protein